MKVAVELLQFKIIPVIIFFKINLGDNDMDKKKYTLLLIVIIGVIMVLWGKELTKNKIKKDLGNYDYAIGNIDVFFYRAPVGNNVRFSSITYSYVVNNIRYVNNYDALDYKLPSSPDVNDKFMVVFNKKDPKKSLLLGDYPIKTEEDFKIFIDTNKNFKIKF
ncbi:hypothetical protein [Flavobacterium piscisymbiosum]|uniref:Uncharacterized protein n=1 Tax=Flavobacterium piscisymbiosum TaxID=2893753 RepID=A0ABS8MEQ9_9FLAO|nr:hypothetical protein [Flavobacterium sp. F-30]MCC9063987.1 hypothetical protein [Flavobacterium sp. F-30]